MALTTKVLKQLTATLASDLAVRGVAAQELAAIHPGGTENPRRDGLAWLRYYGRLCGMRAVLGDGDAPTSTTEQHAAADRIVLEALAGSPVPVTIGHMPCEGLVAYPKSTIALLKVHTRNLLIGQLLAGVQGLQGSEDPAALELIDEALTEAAYQHRVIAWIACTEGVALPFPETEAAPVLPEQFRDLTPQSIHAICRAFDTANWARLQALQLLITPDPESDEPRKRPSWSQFFASFANDKDSSESVLRNRALVALFATVQLAASAQRDAMAAAKDRAKQHEDQD